MSQAENWGLLTAAPASVSEQTARINDADNALMTLHAGVSRPSYLTTGLWRKVVSSSIEELYHFDGTHDILLGTLNPTTGAWVPSGTGANVVAITSSTTLTSAHNNALLAVDATSAAVTLTLPTISSVGEPYNVRIKKVDASENAVTIARSGTDTIDDGTDSLSLTGQNDSVTVSADIDKSPDNWVSVVGGGGVSESEFAALKAQAIIAVLDTAQATTSGTAKTFSKPAEIGTVIRATMMVRGVSLSGTQNLMAQAGSSGAAKTTGYQGSTGRVTTSVNVAAWSAGALFGADASAASQAYQGRVVFSLETGTDWTIDGKIGRSDAAALTFLAGGITLDAALDTIVLTNTGSDTFDAGSVNVLWEGFAA